MADIRGPTWRIPHAHPRDPLQPPFRQQPRPSGSRWRSRKRVSSPNSDEPAPDARGPRGTLAAVRLHASARTPRVPGCGAGAGSAPWLRGVKSGRLLARRVPALGAGWTRHETGPWSMDAVFQSLDRTRPSRRRLRALARVPWRRVCAAFTPTRTAPLATFREARRTGTASCFYDLPIGYWRAGQRDLLPRKRNGCPRGRRRSPGAATARPSSRAKTPKLAGRRRRDRRELVSPGRRLPKLRPPSDCAGLRRALRRAGRSPRRNLPPVAQQKGKRPACGCFVRRHRWASARGISYLLEAIRLPRGGSESS